jgi:hypothetical protein
MYINPGSAGLGLLFLEIVLEEFFVRFSLHYIFILLFSTSIKTVFFKIQTSTTTKLSQKNVQLKEWLTAIESN